MTPEISLISADWVPQIPETLALEDAYLRGCVSTSSCSSVTKVIGTGKEGSASRKLLRYDRKLPQSQEERLFTFPLH